MNRIRQTTSLEEKFASVPGSYGLQDWEFDFAWFCAKQAELQAKGLTCFPDRIIPDYFRNKYGAEDLFHLHRLTAAMRYLERRIEEFDIGKMAIFGEEEAAIGRPLIRALYLMYARCPDEHVFDDFPVELVRGFAEKMTLG